VPKTNRLVSLLSLNTASLALFRVLTALSTVWHLSVHHSLLVTLVALLPAAAMALGYRTRVMAGLLLVIAGFLIALNWETLSAADIGMALLCTWCVGLPVNEQWSVDAALQSVYQDNPNATSTMTHRIRTLYSPLTKLVVIGVLVFVAFSLITNTNGLSVFIVTALTLLTPISLWEQLRVSFRASPRYQQIQQLVIFYDEDCGFCLKMCLVLRELLLTQDTRIITAQSNDAIFAIMDANNSWVIQSANKDTHIHWHAMQHLFAQRWPFKVVAWIMNLPPLMRLGNAVYAWVAENRSTMSRITAWALPWGKLPEKPRLFTVIWVVALSVELTVLFIQAAVL